MFQPVALITGCSSGIGRALADAFRASGYAVWATARRDEDVAALDQAGFRGVRLDVTDSAAVAALAERLRSEVGGLDVLINNAGYGAMGPLLDGGAEVLRQQFETNVFAVVELSRACLPLLRERKGTLVNIGSVSGVLVTPFAGAYCASKAAVHALNEALRLELAPFGIAVLEVQPGAIASSFGANANRSLEGVVAEDSPWWPLREFIRARANASQDKPTPATELARQVLGAVHRNPVPRLLRVGHGSRALPLLARWLPTALLDRALKKRFGLNGEL